MTYQVQTNFAVLRCQVLRPQRTSEREKNENDQDLYSILTVKEHASCDLIVHKKIPCLELHFWFARWMKKIGRALEMLRKKASSNSIACYNR